MTDPPTKAFEMIKSFHGTSRDNARDWCDRAEIIFNAFNINDVDRLVRIGLKMEDDAFNWYRDNRGPYATWLNFRQALEQAFPPPERTQNRHLLAEQINQRKQGPDETVHAYFYSLDKLCREYNPGMSPMDKAIKLVSGLREDLKEKILPMNVQTPEEFMIQAKNFESSQIVMANHRKQNGSCELSEPTYNFESNDYPMIATTGSHQQQVHPQRPRMNHRQQNFTQSNPPNFHRQHAKPSNHPSLRQRNHRQDHGQFQDVRTQNQATQQIESSHPGNRYPNNNGYSNIDHRRCFQCGQKGHFQRFCPYHLNE